MCAAKRLSPQLRKQEIMKAAGKLFVEKGYAHTTMEDIVAGTSLSKGGLYYYYKNTAEILHDIMEEGLKYRLNIMKSFKDGLKECNDIDFMADSIMEKIIDSNPYTEIYVEFLLAKKKDPELEELFKEIKEKTRQEFKRVLVSLPEIFWEDSTYDFLTDYINSMIIGANILDARDNFIKNKELLIKIAGVILEKEE